MKMTIFYEEMEAISDKLGCKITDKWKDINRLSREFIHQAIKEKLNNS